MSSLCIHWFSLDNPTSSHSPLTVVRLIGLKTALRYELFYALQNLCEYMYFMLNMKLSLFYEFQMYIKPYEFIVGITPQLVVRFKDGWKIQT